MRLARERFRGRSLDRSPLDRRYQPSARRTRTDSNLSVPWGRSPMKPANPCFFARLNFPVNPREEHPGAHASKKEGRRAHSNAEGISESNRGLSEAAPHPYPSKGGTPAGVPETTLRSEPMRDRFRCRGADPILCHPSAGWGVLRASVRWCRCAPTPATFSVPFGNNALAPWSCCLVSFLWGCPALRALGVCDPFFKQPLNEHPPRKHPTR
jgi:hypothetical protein